MAERPVNVLVFGASNVLFSDAGPEASLFALLGATLESQAPEISWHLVAAEIPPARNMAARTLEAVRTSGATAAYYMPSSSYFAYDFVVARVRRRYPWALGLVERLGGGLKEAAGGQFEGAAGPRGLLYRIPHLVAEKVIGGEPYIQTDYAIENTVSTLRQLGELDDFVLVAREPFTRVRTHPAKLRRYLERIDNYAVALRQCCAELGFTCYSLPDYMAAKGMEPLYVEDQIHMTLETRQQEAEAAAEHLLRALALKGSLAGRQEAASS